MERFINILIVDDNPVNQRGLKEILNGGGNNVLLANGEDDALKALKQREIGIVVVNIDSTSYKGIPLIEQIKQFENLNNIYRVALVEKAGNSSNLVKALNAGAVDFITMPFNPNLVKAKIDIYKSLYYKDGRIRQLLTNIFPEKVLEDLNQSGKFTPKRVNNGVVLFTDFVNFSAKAKSLNPMKLLKRLESYFTKFDEITRRYKIEKIKTIGDSYMAIAGVTEALNHPEVRACLAALEMRNYMTNERDIVRAMNKDSWGIRIGIHSGPLVAGVIGSTKFSFDVWGDTVNIASRAEQAAPPDSILITESIANVVEPYFDLIPYGSVEIKKRGGKLTMFELKRLRLEYCLYGEGKIANTQLLKQCDLPGVDFDHMQKDILNRLRSMLPEDLFYHDINHTLNVERAAIRLARLEGIRGYDLMLLRTAVYYHDAGFLVSYQHNEIHGIRMARNLLPYFGFGEEDVETIAAIIETTNGKVAPVTLLQQIMCDADHDYLGRADYYNVARKLREELEFHDQEMSDLEWIDFQLNYLEHKHQYYTQTARNIRLQGKLNRIQELKLEREKLLTDS